MDSELEAHRAWQQPIVATYRLHEEVRELVRTGLLSVGPFGALSTRLDEADAALNAWVAASGRCEDA